MKILIINGPNLNLLGTREPHIYGNTTMADCLLELRHRYAGDEIEYFQSNHEGEIIDRLHKVHHDGTCDGIVLNAGAFTHTSLAIADAVSAISVPVVEVHITNIAARQEEVRHRSLLTPVTRGIIAGFGLDSYRLGVEAIKEISK